MASEGVVDTVVSIVSVLIVLSMRGMDHALFLLSGRFVPTRQGAVRRDCPRTSREPAAESIYCSAGRYTF